jgi:hypothetical protein
MTLPNIVLDIDGTLVHTFDPRKPENKDKPYDFTLTTGYHVSKRQYLDFVLPFLIQAFNVHVYTAGMRSYALEILDNIDPQKRINRKHLIAREDVYNRIVRKVDDLYYVPYNPNFKLTNDSIMKDGQLYIPVASVQMKDSRYANNPHMISFLHTVHNGKNATFCHGYNPDSLYLLIDDSGYAHKHSSMVGVQIPTYEGRCIDSHLFVIVSRIMQSCYSCQSEPEPMPRLYCPRVY